MVEWCRQCGEKVGEDGAALLSCLHNHGVLCCKCVQKTSKGIHCDECKGCSSFFSHPDYPLTSCAPLCGNCKKGIAQWRCDVCGTTGVDLCDDCADWHRNPKSEMDLVRATFLSHAHLIRPREVSWAEKLGREAMGRCGEHHLAATHIRADYRLLCQLCDKSGSVPINQIPQASCTDMEEGLRAASAAIEAMKTEVEKKCEEWQYAVRAKLALPPSNERCPQFQLARMNRANKMEDCKIGEKVLTSVRKWNETMNKSSDTELQKLRYPAEESQDQEDSENDLHPPKLPKLLTPNSRKDRKARLAENLAGRRKEGKPVCWVCLDEEKWGSSGSRAEDLLHCTSSNCKAYFHPSCHIPSLLSTPTENLRRCHACTTEEEIKNLRRDDVPTIENMTKYWKTLDYAKETLRRNLSQSKFLMQLHFQTPDTLLKDIIGKKGNKTGVNVRVKLGYLRDFMGQPHHVNRKKDLVRWINHAFPLSVRNLL